MIERLPFAMFPPTPTLTILIFHRVLAATDALRPGEPDVPAFARMMRLVAQNFVVLPLPEAVERLTNGRLARRTCCITFDDGYADNLHNALPVLEAHRLPATVFVATGYLDGGRMFNDVVTDAIAVTQKTLLDLTELDLGRHPVGDTASKRAAITAILGAFKRLPPGIREPQVRRFLELAGCASLPADIMLNCEQLLELSRRGVEIGGHTVAHTILTTLDDEQALNEMLAGKQRLEAITGRLVDSFAYPNGRPGRDYVERHVGLVQKAGFARAVTTEPGVACRASDVFQLPRFTPWALNSAKAAGQLLRNAWR